MCQNNAAAIFAMFTVCMSALNPFSTLPCDLCRAEAYTYQFVDIVSISEKPVTETPSPDVWIEVPISVTEVSVKTVEPTAPTPTSVPTPTPAPTPIPVDESISALKPQPPNTSRKICLFSRSETAFNLYLSSKTLLIPEDGMPIPLLYQYDYMTTVCTVNGNPRSPKTSGCGATVVSMLDVYINGNYAQTPYTVFYDAARDGLYEGNGIDYLTVLKLARQRGIEIACVDRTEESMRKALEDGCPIILRMGSGEFTNAGHYILLRGLDENGDVLVNDPNSAEHSRKSYTLRQLDREAKAHDMLRVTPPSEDGQP